jgi:hypothetical protein
MEGLHTGRVLNGFKGLKVQGFEGLRVAED